MSNRKNQIPSHMADDGYAQGAIRPVSPGILAIALLLALTTSVATASMIESTDPARLDRREAPRELSVRWLASAVAKAARDLAANEVKTNTVTSPAIAPVHSIALSPEPTVRISRDVISTIPDGWPAQGLVNLPPPSVR